MTQGEAVGRVMGTADATPLQFWTAVSPGSYLQLDDVVVTTRELPDAPPVLVLTTFDDEETVAAALGAGAAGFVLKDAPGEEIVWATTKVAQGESWLDPQVTSQVLDAYRRIAGRRRTQRDRIGQLTEREEDVLRLVGSGANNAEIARALHIGEATVKSHLGHVLTKLDLRDRAAAIVFAHEHGLV